MRDAISALPASKIRQVANSGLGRDDVLAFWFGESDEVTPEPVRAAAMLSLARGETLYSHNLGLAELRDSLRRYTEALHGRLGDDRIAVTSAGVSALMIATQMLVGGGDEVVVVVPVWPNLPAQPAILGASVRRVGLAPDASGAWRLDLQRLLDTVTDRTKMLLLNAPNNPTGWTLGRAEQQAILEHCRRTGTWIVADEVYERLWFGASARCAPSFLDIATEHDRLIVVQSFSKSFLMTGWRLGWMVLPAGFIEAAGKLIEFNSSCAPVFVQRGGLAALASADTTVPELVGRMRHCRDTLINALRALPRVRVAAPEAGMYVFFGVEGENDSLAFATRLVREFALGLAPGAAFGAEGEGWLRWCFASRDPARLTQGAERLARGLSL